jgi:hypothetical protein
VMSVKTTKKQEILSTTLSQTLKANSFKLIRGGENRPQQGENSRFYKAYSQNALDKGESRSAGF